MDTELTGRLATLEERVGHLPRSKDLQAVAEQANDNIRGLRSELGQVLRDENKTLREDLAERLGNQRSAILSELAIDRATLKDEIFAEFKRITDEAREAQERLWRKIGIFAGLLPFVIILLLWLTGTMTSHEAASAALGSM